MPFMVIPDGAMVSNHWYAVRIAARCRTAEDVEWFERAAIQTTPGREFLAGAVWAGMRSAIMPASPADRWVERAAGVQDFAAAEELMLAAVPSVEGRAFLLSPAWMERVAAVLLAEEIVPG